MIHNISIATADDVTYFGDNVKYIPCIFTQGNYHLGMLSQLVRKDYCFRPIFGSICCKLIWEHPWPLSVVIFSYFKANFTLLCTVF